MGCRRQRIGDIMQTKKANTNFIIPGSWLVILGAFIWSSSSAVIKAFDADPLYITGIRSLIAALILLPTLRPRKIKFDRWLFIYCVAYAIMATIVIYSLQMTTTTSVIAMKYSAPVWLFLAACIYQKKLIKNRLLIIILIIAAIAIILSEPLSGAALWGNWLSVLFGVFFALTSYCLGRIEHDNTLGLMVLMNAITAALILPFCYILPGINTQVEGMQWLSLIIMALQLSLGYACYSLGVKKISSQRASLLAVWEFILTPAWSFVLIREIPSIYVVIGSLVLLSALVLDGLQAQKNALNISNN